MKQIEALEQAELDRTDRRGFLQAAGRLAAAITLLGLSSETAEAATTEVERARLRLMIHAIRTGDAKAALAQYGEAAQLDATQRKAIAAIPASDFAAVRNTANTLGSSLGFLVPCYAIPGGCKGDDADAPVEEPSSDGGRKIGIIIY